MAYTAGKNSKILAVQQYNNDRLKEKYDKKFSNELKELGKVSAFKEEFEGIKLENQVFPQIPTIENITENQFFNEGRKFGYALIAGGFDLEKYNAYTKAREEKETKKHR